MFTFYAKTNKAFIKSLQNELVFLGVKQDSIVDLNFKGLNYLKFKSEMSSVWRIMLHSRLIENVKIQIKDNIPAKTEKEFKININKLNYEKFIPMKNAEEFKIPEIKAYSYRSSLFHEGMIENILKTSLNKLAYKQRENTAEEEIEESKSKMKVDYLEEKLVRKLQERKNCKRKINLFFSKIIASNRLDFTKRQSANITRFILQASSHAWI